MNLDGTVAITGAGRGLGRALVLDYARRGHHVLALVQNDDHHDDLRAAVSGFPGKVMIQSLDVTAIGHFDFPDDLQILINNAGVRLKYLAVEDISMTEWRHYFDVNFFGAVELAQKAIPILRKRTAARQDGGPSAVICNINSESLTIPLPFMGAYRSTKGAMAAFSETLRIELAPLGIRVVEIHPGGVKTGLAETSLAKGILQAVDNPVYEPMARRQLHWAATSTARPIEVVDAAAAIVASLADDDGPMRYGTCASSSAAIEGWRPGGGKPAARKFIEILRPDPDP